MSVKRLNCFFAEQITAIIENKCKLIPMHWPLFPLLALELIVHRSPGSTFLLIPVLEKVKKILYYWTFLSLYYFLHAVVDPGLAEGGGGARNMKKAL